MFLPKLFKKFLLKPWLALFLVFCFLFLTIFSKPLFAYSSGESPFSYFFSFENAVFRTEEMNLQSFVWETIKATTISLVEIITVCVTCPEDQGGTQGLIPMVGGAIASIYSHPPASGVEYLAYVFRKIDPVSTSYAQQEGSVGFREMSSYLPIWSVFRNLAYSFFVIIFIFIGFAIMFRIKISPQAVVTIESALPKLIIALLLITFSYSIVGFMVDIMMVVNNLVIFAFKSMPGNIPEFVRNILPSASITDARQFLQTILGVGIPPILISFMILGFLGGIGVVIATAATGGGAAIPSLIGLGIAVLILAVVFLIALIRLLWTLLKAYVMVILSLIFSPFIILVGALPGSNTISSWFRNILANLAVLPTVLVMVFLSGYLSLMAIYEVPNLGPLVEGYMTGQNSQTGNPVDRLSQVQGMQNIIANPGVADSLGAMFVLFMVSLVILLLAPKASDIIQSFLSGKPFAYGAAIGEAVGPLTGIAGTAWGLGKQAAGGEVMYQVGTRYVQPKAAKAPGGAWSGIEQWMKRQKYIP